MLLKILDLVEDLCLAIDPCNFLELLCSQMLICQLLFPHSGFIKRFACHFLVFLKKLANWHSFSTCIHFLKFSFLLN